ncbi:hypothetical protein, partial [Acinetobacter baumannii]|uniref:hypothetical protein n=1 Tax=Acinetobacter baumannii TaxID=470 RepID=UPI001BB36BFA
ARALLIASISIGSTRLVNEQSFVQHFGNIISYFYDIHIYFFRYSYRIFPINFQTLNCFAVLIAKNLRVIEN